MKNERMENILNFIKQNKQASVQKICKTFFYSEASVRRDLKSLADMNLIVRTYGGAMFILYVKTYSYKNERAFLRAKGSFILFFRRLNFNGSPLFQTRSFRRKRHHVALNGIFERRQSF